MSREDIVKKESNTVLPDKDGWYTHTGSTKPSHLDDDTLIEVVLNIGSKGTNRAGGWYWGRYGASIAKYRIVPYIENSIFKDESTISKTEVQTSGRVDSVSDVFLFINGKEESKMSNVRRVVNVKLIDQDPALPVENSLIGSFDSVVTESSDDVLIREILFTGEVKGLLEQHNLIRKSTIDLDKSGSRDVYLQPLKVESIHWQIIKA